MKARGSKEWCTTLIVGATKEDFLVMDPLNGSREFTPLSAHGKVYAHRVLVRAASIGE